VLSRSEHSFRRMIENSMTRRKTKFHAYQVILDVIISSCCGVAALSDAHFLLSTKSSKVEAKVPSFCGDPINLPLCNTLTIAPNHSHRTDNIVDWDL
jgi:hypothetical protein